MPRVLILDYGMGNLHSVRKAFEVCGCTAALSHSAVEIQTCDALVVPGVGSFGDCVSNLSRLGLREALANYIQSGKPYLGLCLGLQILFSSSEESPGIQGLDVFHGRVRRFTHELKIPHMGWNTLTFIPARAGDRSRSQPSVGADAECPLFRGIEDGAYVYFVHSYYPEIIERGIIAATTDYGVTFASAVWRGALMATQFHPEKSQRVGLAMIRNFIEFVESKE
jgi:imidazole glycerol-phosphate synthase subunit HisH